MKKFFIDLFASLFTKSNKTNMEKELYEQPKVISNLLNKYLLKRKD